MRKILMLMIVCAFVFTGCSPDNEPSDVSESFISDVSVPQSAETQNSTEETPSAPETSSEDAADDEYSDYVKQIAEEEELYDISRIKEITAYGRFQSYTYYSQTAERDTRVNILLPPNYSEDKEYPVLYILHGFYDNEEWMARRIVGIPEMLTELYGSGQAAEMIVVLPYIFVSKDMPYCTGMDLDNCFAYDNFINDLTTDLMPFIESSFSVKKGRENTAVTGFSMGGRESLFIGLSLPDVFGYVGACCPAPGLVPIPGSAMHPGQLSESELVFPESQSPRVLFISAGSNDGVVGGTPADYDRIFTENGAEHFYDLMDGTSHDNTSVTPHLYKFFRMIFK
ncbi:MAG: esterase family protein [Ruminococcus sp.]|nr:esterase family protein [Ruminococcus sp.]